MPVTKSPLTPDGEDDDDVTAKRSVRSYRTYDGDEQYTPFSDDNYDSADDRTDRRKRSGVTLNGRRAARRSDGSKAAGNKAAVVRHFARSRNSPGSRDYVTQRVLSARRLKMNELKNEIELISKELFEIKKENLLLRRTQVIQERNLGRFEDKESNLPQLIDSHSREVRSLREQIRKYKDKGERTLRSLHDVEDELVLARKQLRKLQALADDRNLVERDELSRRLESLEASSEAKGQRVKELERHIENLEKNHSRELRSEMKKVKDAKAENEQLQQNVEKLQQQLKEKDKELEIANIYHGRLFKAQQRSLPALDAPPSPRPPYNRKAQTPDASPREKARLLDEKRRDVMRKRRETSEKQLAIAKVSDPSKGLPPQPRPPAERRAEQATASVEVSHGEREDSWEKIRAQQELIYAAQEAAAVTRPPSPHRDGDEPKSTSYEDVAVHRGRRAVLDDGEGYQPTVAVGGRRFQPQSEQRIAREAKEEAERRERAAREEKEAEARLERERYEREERRRLERERELREREERERRLKQEREEREAKEAEERKAQEEQRLATDAAASEERRKKDMLLRMMKDIDNKKDVTPPTEGLDTTSGQDSKAGLRSKKKDYTFRDVDESLHQGIPVRSARKTYNHLDETPGKAKADESGYAPSSVTGSTARKPAFDSRDASDDKAGAVKKSKLLDSLFGQDNAKSNQKVSSFGDDDIFSSSTKAKPVADRRAYPWELDVGSSGTKVDKDDEVVLMPLRPRLEPAAVHSKPAVKAVSSVFDDDIEELVL